VFPGGRVDEDDRRPDDTDDLPAARRAAVRESKEEAGLAVDEASLVTFANWCPPPEAPKRFATWFFLAPAPAGEVVVDGGEIHDHQWRRPADVLAARDEGELGLAPPTWVSLWVLQAHATVAAALAAAGDPEFFATRIGHVDGGIAALWHGDAGYETGDASAPGARHRLLMVEPTWTYERS
jgi:hypothetical protein